MSTLPDISGRVFGRLTVLLGPPSRDSRGKSVLGCVCECGAQTTARRSDLLRGNKRSCGCLQRDRRVRHGRCNAPGYKSLMGAVRRCHNPHDKDFRNYGARGISVFPLWRTASGIADFLAEIGPRPSPRHSIDRKENSGNYEPGNVRWALPVEQIANRRKMGVLASFTDEELLAEASRRNILL